ncbi:MAG: outer membrane protein [Parvibaculaceae bacterium]
MISRRLSALTVGFFFSTALSGAVMAADVEQPYMHDWTGLYVGGHVGWGWIDLKGSYQTEDAVPGLDFLDGGEGAFKLKDDGFLGGLQAGYNLQINNFVLGIEGDVSFVNWDEELTNFEGEQVSFDTDFVATLRARAGFAMDNFLLFGTAGVAWTDTKFEVDDGDGGGNATGKVDLDDIGFAVGGGAEYAFDENWSIKAEALYLIFDDKEDTEFITEDSEIGDFIKLEDIFIARIGVNFHF